MIYQKKTLVYYIHNLFAQFWNIAVLLGHLIVLSITKKLKKIQRRVTKLVKSGVNLPYCDRLNMLDLTTLNYRRLRAGVIQVYRIINRINKLKLSNCFHCNTRPLKKGSLWTLFKYINRLNKTSRHNSVR